MVVVAGGERSILSKDVRLWIGFSMVAVVVVMAVLGILEVFGDPNETDLGQRLLPPSKEHPLGTDHFGRDLLARIVGGATISLQVSLAAGVMILLLGTTLGIVAGFFRNALGSAAVNVIDTLLAIPPLILAILAVATIGAGVLNATVAISFALAPRLARIVRSVVLSLRERVFVEAAGALGASELRVLIRYILPNVAPVVLVTSSILIANAIVVEASLSFLGLGTQPPNPSWGLIVSEGRQTLRSAPWNSGSGGVAIMWLVLGLNLLGDAVRDRSDPHLRRELDKG
ncbi:MAG: ABC transporter permease [Trueperaceae bacterium]